MKPNRLGRLAWMAALLIAGCQASIPSSEVHAQDSPRDLSTPERALHSYWNAQDQFELGADGKRLKEASDQAQAPFLTGHEAAFARIRVIPYVFERKLVAQTPEPDGRVSLTVDIRNRSPFPAGVQLNDYARKRREEGDRYRYVMAQVGGQWRISEILVYLPDRSPPTWKQRHSLEPFATTHTEP